MSTCGALNSCKVIEKKRKDGCIITLQAQDYSLAILAALFHNIMVSSRMEAALNVLYLEDSDFDIDLVRRFINTRENCHLTCISNESDALHFLKNEHPDIFLVDVVIEGEAVHNLVELTIKKGFAGVVIPMATGASLEELRFYKGLGCSQIINKPFTVDDLTRVFEAISAQTARVK